MSAVTENLRAGDVGNDRPSETGLEGLKNMSIPEKPDSQVDELEGLKIPPEAVANGADETPAKDQVGGNGAEVNSATQELA